MSEDQPSLIDTLDALYQIEDDGESGHVEYDPDGADKVELVYKFYARMLDDDPEFIELIDESWAIEGMTLTRVRNEIIEEYNNIEKSKKSILEDEEISDADLKELEEGMEAFFEISVADQVLLFYTLANEVLKGIYGDLIYRNVFESNGHGDQSRDYAKNIDQITQEELLYHMGEIDEGLKGELVNVRKTRNKVVHDIRERHYLSNIPNIENMIDRSIDSINKIHENVYGDILI